MFEEYYMKIETREKCFYDKFCCICMNKSDLKRIFDVDSDGISHYNKLTSSIAEMDFEEMNDQRLICEGCCVTLDTVYTFRQACLRSKTNLITYVSQLRTNSHVSGTPSIPLEDVKPEIIVVKEETETKCENEDGSSSFEENKRPSDIKTGRYEERINFPASVKEEWESGDDSNTREEATADHADERGHGDVKLEDAGHQTISEIDIDEHEVKEETMSDAGTPLDGSSSGAVADTSGEPNESGKDKKTRTRGSYKCKTCNKCFVYKCYLSKHMPSHSGERPYECEVCKKSFIHNNDLTKHLRKHSSEKPHECEVCKKGFVHESDLTTHMRVHSGERPYECEVCKKRFTHKSDYTRHMRIHSGERPYECVTCAKNFIHKCDLTQHMRLHSGERPYACETCKKGFTRKCELTKHMRVHSGERPYGCELCNRSFVYKGDHTNHMRVHSGERPFECKVCDKSFVYKGEHTSHMRTHAGERPHKCETCNKSFVQKSDFTRHMRIHSGERPYGCEVCKKSFIHTSDFSRHMRIHTGERPYKCEICKKTFIQKHHLNGHMLKHSDGR